jgi:uncharacterized protein YacL
MNISLSFIRIFFVALCTLFVTAYTTTLSTNGLSVLSLVLGLIAGLFTGLLLVSTDLIFRRFNLRSFNTAALGLFFGLMMGQVIWSLFDTVLDFSEIGVRQQTLTLVRMAVFLLSSYLGMVMTARAAEEIHISLPFVKFKQTSHKKKDIVIDSSILTDSRIIDLATSGLLDHHLILPRFILNELQGQSEGADEALRSKARRCLDVIKKLESIPTLDMRYADTDFPEVKDPMSKLIRLARLLDCNLITADISRVQQSTVEVVRIINIHMLSNALKPLTQAGEYLSIKIQRYGKEARQGVGYLEDGTMVVVNGGAEHIGETIKAQVLSVKHTSSGRMIFCNSTDESSLSEQEIAQSVASIESSHKTYFAL